MRKRTINVFVFGAVVLTLALFGCSSGNVADTTAPGAAAIDGVALYTSNCSGCHGPLGASGKKGASASQIQNAIAQNWGGMGAFTGLTTDQLQAIATALAPVTATNTPATAASLDGAALYSTNCQNCHNALTTSTKAGRTATQIQAAIAGNYGGMSRFSNLTAAQVQAIADALATVSAVTPAPSEASNSLDGAALYAQYCQGCHQQLASSTKKGRSATQIQTAINTYTDMKPLAAALTQPQINAIASALAPASGSTSGETPTSGGTMTSTDGAALYAQYCQGCHQPLASSTKMGRTATQIQTAINTYTGMKPLATTLTQPQIDAIASALAPASGSTSGGTPSSGGTTTSTDGASLYTQYCSGCHGSLAASSKVGRTSTQIQTAINGIADMSSLKTLSTTQIDAIASALATAPTPAPTDGAALYTTYCSSCHGALASSSVRGSSANTISTALSGVSQMMSISLTSTQIQAIATALGTTPSTTPTPTPTLVCGSCHAIPPATGQHSRHVISQGYSCSTCHGSGYSSTTVNTATHMNGTVNIASTIGWNATTRSCSNSCHGTHYWGGTATAPSPSPSTPPTDGATLYSNNCAVCHGPLATSYKSGATANQIQTAITNNLGGMGQFSTFTSTQIQAIATALSTGTTPTTTPPTLVCGSCHAIPPSTGHHTYHVNSRGLSCSRCHGTGYSSTTVNTATHNNGTVNMTTTIGWNPSTRTCSNSCHGTERW